MENSTTASLKPENVIEENKGLILYVIRPIVKDEHDIEDCYSYICQLILEKIDTFDKDKGNLNNWLRVLCHNGAINFAKKKTNQRLSGYDTADSLKLSDLRTPETELIRKENLAILSKAIDALKNNEKELVLRRYYYKQSIEQISRETGMSVRATEGKLYRIRKKLKKQFLEMGGGENE